MAKSVNNKKEFALSREEYIQHLSIYRLLIRSHFI